VQHPTKNIKKRVGVVGSKHTTGDLILGLERESYTFDYAITLPPEKAAEQNVAGFQDLRPLLEERNIPYYQPRKYSLNSEKDKASLLDLKLDLLFVAGWQRLIPNWWLESLSIGAFGMHGSSRPLPHGRGRSPMNWSIIQGKDIFYTHLFKYEPGVDDGPVVGVQTFDINPYDTCLTLHHKNMIAMRQLCVKHLPSLLEGTAKFQTQPKEGATYYPKREAEDGLIFWEAMKTEEVSNLIRAVTHPFPGAFAFLDNQLSQKVFLWRAIPFDTRLQWPGAEPGHIAEVFSDGSFVVKTQDSTLLVQESSGYAFTPKDIGRKLGPATWERKVWKDLPE
jgi:methionyl-tRNA formyltransferase